MASAIAGRIPDARMGPILEYLRAMRKVVPPQVSSDVLLYALLVAGLGPEDEG